jgi:hypothetical protein
MKFTYVVILFLALLGVNGFAQSDNWDGMKPTGTVRVKILPNAVKAKLRVAFEAALDIDSLASVDEYEMANQDAKRAIREARAVAETKDAKEIVGDIELLRMTRETCRSCNTADDFRKCHAVAMLWAARVHTELGLDRKTPVRK